MSIEVYILLLLAILYIYNEKCDVKIYGVINFFANNLKLTAILLLFLVVTFNPNLLVYYYDFNKSSGASKLPLRNNQKVKRNVSESKVVMNYLTQHTRLIILHHFIKVVQMK